jgi:hypothetical protein
MTPIEAASTRPFDILNIFSGRDHSVFATMQVQQSGCWATSCEIGDIDNDGAADFASGD